MLKTWTVRNINKLTSDHRSLLSKYHYSPPKTGIMAKLYFELRDDQNKLNGVVIFSLPAGKNTAKTYSKTSSKNVIELRRIACVDNTPKNAESYFISKCIKWIKKYTQYDVIISYADPYYGHKGTIYQASNFKYIGKQKFNAVMLKWKNKLIQERRLYAKKRNGEYEMNDLRKDYKNGLVDRVYMPKKHIYRYEVR